MPTQLQLRLIYIYVVRFPGETDSCGVVRYLIMKYRVKVGKIKLMIVLD